MSSFQRLLGRDDKFYLLLEASGQQAKAGATQLAQLLPKLAADGASQMLNELGVSRLKHKAISLEITEALCKVFMTPLEREDIEALSAALYKISKNVEKIGERLTIHPDGVNIATIARQLTLLEQCADIVARMVGELRKKTQGELIKGEYERLQSLEGDADRVMNELLRDLYHGNSDARAVVFWKDIYELFEKAVDRCRDAGYVVFHVALKYS